MKLFPITQFKVLFITADVKNGKIYITIDRSVKISVEINGGCENNLMIFAHDTEYDVPQGAENLIVIKKGEERTGTLTVHEDNTTIYLEEGAILQGNIRAENCENEL